MQYKIQEFQWRVRMKRRLNNSHELFPINIVQSYFGSDHSNWKGINSTQMYVAAVENGFLKVLDKG